VIHRDRTAARRVTLSIVLLVVACGSLEGQKPASVRVLPRVGLIAPDAYLYEQFTNFAGDGPVEWTTGSLGRAFLAGVGAELQWGSGGVLVRAEVLRSFDGWLSAVHGIVIPRVVFEPPEIVNTFLDVPVSMTLTSVQVVLPTRLELWRFQPYVAAGVGGKFYSFDDPIRPNEVDAVLPNNGFTWGGDLGAGVMVEVRGLTVDLQVRDAVSRYWDKTQHDLAYSAALVWEVW
jgi:hypothetical protein